MITKLSRRLYRRAFGHHKRSPADALRAGVIDQRWRWPVLLALAGTVPAFYVEILSEAPSWLAPAAYLLAALTLLSALLQIGRPVGTLASLLAARPQDLLLVVGLLLAAAAPPSSTSSEALGLRLVVAFLTLVRMGWELRHLLNRGGLGHMLVSATGLLGLCGLGFWWLEPKTPTFGDGLWLAFNTAATVGYGDIVPSTVASKIFSVFVVLLGFGTLSLVTAAIATRWIETEERIIEREILRDMHRQMAALNQEIAGLRQDLLRHRGAAGNASTPASTLPPVGDTVDGAPHTPP